MSPGTSVRVKFLRDGAEKNVTVKLAELPADAAAPRPSGGRNFNQNPGNQNPGYQNPGYQNPGYQNPGNQAPGGRYPDQGYGRGQDPGVYRGQPGGPAQSYSHNQDPGTYRGQGGGPYRGNEQGDQRSALSGVAVQNLDAQIARQLRLSAMTRGVVVTDVAQGTPAAMGGLQAGDVIQEVDHARVYTTNDFDRALRRTPGHTVLLLVNRQGGTVYLAVQPR
jgi:hypothetical protein